VRKCDVEDFTITVRVPLEQRGLATHIAGHSCIMKGLSCIGTDRWKIQGVLFSMGYRQSHRVPWAASRVTSHISHWPRGSLVWAKPPCNHETTASKRAWNGLEPRLYTTRSQEFVPGTSNTATCLFWVLEPLRPVFFAVERSIVLHQPPSLLASPGYRCFRGFETAMHNVIWTCRYARDPWTSNENKQQSSTPCRAAFSPSLNPEVRLVQPD